jgi:hypothetical protein
MQRYNWIAALLVLLTLGCRPEASPLKRTTLQLRPALSKENVASLFSDYRVVLAGDERRSAREIGQITLFKPDNVLSSFVTYAPIPGKNDLGYQEECTVWFNTNQVLVAFQYRILN